MEPPGRLAAPQLCRCFGPAKRVLDYICTTDTGSCAEAVQAEAVSVPVTGRSSGHPAAPARWRASGPPGPARATGALLGVRRAPSAFQARPGRLHSRQRAKGGLLALPSRPGASWRHPRGFPAPQAADRPSWASCGVPAMVGLPALPSRPGALWRRPVGFLPPKPLTGPPGPPAALLAPSGVHHPPQAADGRTGPSLRRCSSSCGERTARRSSIRPPGRCGASQAPPRSTS